MNDYMGERPVGGQTVVGVLAHDLRAPAAQDLDRARAPDRRLGAGDHASTIAASRSPAGGPPATARGVGTGSGYQTALLAETLLQRFLRGKNPRLVAQSAPPARSAGLSKYRAPCGRWHHRMVRARSLQWDHRDCRSATPAQAIARTTLDRRSFGDSGRRRAGPNTRAGYAHPLQFQGRASRRM